MDFELTKEQKLLRKMVRSFAENEVAPLAEEIDRTGRFPAETIAKMTELGLMGLNVPKEYGGQGLPDTCKIIVVSELAKACASTAEAFAVQMLVNFIIKKFGSEEQKREFLPRACKGELGVFALSEPSAGSDPSSIRMTAEEDGDSYVLNGQKTFISNLSETEGDFIVVVAVTDPEKRQHGGMTAFLIDRKTPGVSVGTLEDKMGIRAACVSELLLNDCRVPRSCVLGSVGEGFKVAMGGLDSGRVGIAAQSCGIAEAALKEALKNAVTRVQFGKRIADQQGIQFYLADMATRVETAYLMTYKAAALLSEGKRAGKYSSMAKYYASETANYVAQKAVQIYGGYGYVRGTAIERIFRDARVLTLYEGTSEIQKIVIAREIIKEAEGGFVE